MSQNVIIERLPKYNLTKKQITGNKIKNEFLGIFNNDKYQMKPKYKHDTEFYKIRVPDKKKMFQPLTYINIGEVYFAESFNIIDIKIQEKHFDGICDIIIGISDQYKKQDFQIKEVEDV